PRPTPSPTPPPPAVTAINPNVGPAIGGTNVTVDGAGFTGVTKVTFGGTAATGVTFVSDTQVKAVSPVHVGGTVDVQVTTPSGTSAANPADLFTFTNWTAVTPASPAPSPPVRQGQAMAFDANNKTSVLFGGEDCTTGCVFLNDTWAWNGSAWAAGGGRVRPSGRSGGAMAYDPGSKTVVLVGGYDGTSDVNDVWSWNGAGWTRLLTNNASCIDSTSCPTQPEA